MLDNLQTRQEKLFSRYSDSAKEKFKRFHTENPEIYKEFLSLAKQMKATGRQRYSAEAILQVIRWHRDITTTGDQFKVSNNFRSMYARFVVFHHPEFEGWFVMHGIND